jgi:hypothetical protein
MIRVLDELVHVFLPSVPEVLSDSLLQIMVYVNVLVEMSHHLEKAV